MVLIDTNVLMYAHGADHPFKAPSIRLLDRIATDEVAAAINTETFQEILHRYRSVGRWVDGRALYDSARKLFGVVLPVTPADTDMARHLLDENSGLRARDAIHAAICIASCGSVIVSFDTDFDEVKQVRRLEPSQV